MTNPKESNTLLNRLLLAQMYRTEAYRKAVETVADPELRRFFAANVRSGESIMDEITRRIDPRYITETDDTTLPNAYQRWWNSLPETVVGTSRNHTVEHFLTGEKLAVGLYNHALSAESAEPLRDMLLRQRETLVHTGEQARHLRRSRLLPFFQRMAQLGRRFRSLLVSG
jgi:hypothetical protein